MRRVLTEDGHGMEKQWGRPAEAGRHPLFYFLLCSSSDKVPLAFHFCLHVKYNRHRQLPRKLAGLELTQAVY